jgi:putative peptidoglycan lipid II flippase
VPVLSSLFSIGVNIAFCTYMAPRSGFAMLALGTTLSMFVNCVILAVMLRHDLRLSWNFFFNARLAKLIFATVLMALSAEKLSEFTLTSDNQLLSKIIHLSWIGAVSMGIFITALLVCGERDAAFSLVRRVTARFKKR